MSNFWATRLAGGAPAAPAAPVPQVAPPVAVPWWANDYSAAVPAQPQPQAYAPPQESRPMEERTSGWGSVAGSTRKAKSARMTETCPECTSSNYFRPEGTPNAMLQCYECGYNPRFSQTGGSGGLPSDASGPAQPARQLATAGAGGVSQFSPGTIVAHL